MKDEGGRVRSAWLSFWLLWVLANVIGWSSVALLRIVPFWGPALDVGAALGVSLLQWLCLRFFLDADYTWLVVSAIAYGGYLFVLSMIGGFGDLVVLLAGGASLFALGWLQRFALNDVVDGATAWVFISPLASTMALGLAAIGVVGPESVGRFWATFGLVYGAVTGALLVVLKGWTAPHGDDSVPPWKRGKAEG